MFHKFWSSVKHDFNSNKEETFAPADVRQKFVNEIGLKYGHVATFRKTCDMFGSNLQNTFKIEWIKFSHVEFRGSKIYKCVITISKDVYTNRLANIVNESNNTYHRTIKMKPVDVKSNTYIIDFDKESNEKDPKFEVS